PSRNAYSSRSHTFHPPSWAIWLLFGRATRPRRARSLSGSSVRKGRVAASALTAAVLGVAGLGWSSGSFMVSSIGRRVDLSVVVRAGPHQPIAPLNRRCPGRSTRAGHMRRGWTHRSRNQESGGEGQNEPRKREEEARKAETRGDDPGLGGFRRPE